jgi:cell division protein FtsA
VSNLIISIDIGTSKVSALIGKVNKYSQIEIEGRGMAPCSGLKKGVIVDIESTADSIRKAVEEAEADANMKISSAYVNIHGMHSMSSITRHI